MGVFITIISSNFSQKNCTWTKVLSKPWQLFTWLIYYRVTFKIAFFQTVTCRHDKHGISLNGRTRSSDLISPLKKFLACRLLFTRPETPL